MNLIAAIQNSEAARTAAQAGDFDEVAKILSEPNIAVRNSKAWTMADLISLVGPQAAALVGGTIQAAGATNPIFAGAWIAMNVTGLQLHTDDRQQMIDGLAAAGSWPAELTAAVKAAGLTYTSLAGGTVTKDECSEAWESHKLAQQWAMIQNETINPAVGDRVALITALKSAVDTLEVV